MYDYVIVGAGSAGCVLADRLTEDPDVRVLLVEAGPPDSADAIRMPVAWGALLRSDYDWEHLTAWEPGANDRRIYLPRGRTLGGSSSLNCMIYIRGNPLDFDEWRDTGCPGWGWDDLLPYFLRSEDNEHGASALHGAGGPLAVSDGRSRNLLCQAFIDAAGAAGHPINEDFNGHEQDGFGWYALTQQDGRRCSAADAFLRPALERPNLDVETYAQVRRIVFDGTRAVGVEAARAGELLRWDAEREVIISGGAYNSPHLLMLSGIGRSPELQALQIPVVAESPEVGLNLCDHPQVPISFTCDDEVSLLTAMSEENLARWVTEGSGPLTSNAVEAGGFARTQPDSEAPDVQFHFAPALFEQDGMAAPTQHGFTLLPAVLKPRARGAVTLASPEPSAKPSIVHNYLADEHDARTMVDAIRLGLSLCRTQPLARFAQEPRLVPASDADEDLLAHARKYLMPIFHPVGTCRMGADDDAVVDPELRVRGVEGLRVVDASIMPTIPRGNTNAPVIAVAEKAADLILGRPAPAPPAVSAAR